MPRRNAKPARRTRRTTIMNRAYSVVWNAGRGEWQVVGELAKRHAGKSGGTSLTHRAGSVASMRRFALNALMVAVAGALTMMSVPDAHATSAAWTDGNAIISSGAYLTSSTSAGLIASGMQLGTLTNSGTIVGQSEGILSASGSTISAIVNYGTITGESVAGIYVDNSTIGTLINSGTISSGGYGILNAALIDTIINTGEISSTLAQIINVGTIGTLIDTKTLTTSGADITIDSGSTIAPPSVTVTNLTELDTVIGAGIYNDVSIIGITNNGTILSSGLSILGTVGSSEEFAGIYNTTAGTIGTLTNSSSGVIGSAAAATGIINHGTIGTLSNSGVIAGVDEAILNTGTIGTLLNSGTISGGAEGILNTGTITSLIDAGVIATSGANLTIGSDGATSAALSISNQGVIVSAVEAGVYNAVSISSLTNSGTIDAGEGLSITGNGVASELLTGIYNDTTATIATLTNTATGVIGSTTTEAGIVNYGAIGTLENDGKIIGSLASYNAGTIGTMTNTGTITGVYTAVANTGTIDTLSNSGTMTADMAGVLNIGAIGTMGNSGSISGTNNGLFNENGTIGTLVNTGTISATKYGIFNETGTIGTINNSGLISGGSTAVKTSAGSIGVLNNSGTIVGTINNGILADSTIGTLANSGLISGGVIGIDNSGSTGTIDNSGTIQGADFGLFNDGALSLLSNSGTISGSEYAIYNASTGTIGAIRNTGVIDGNIANLSSNALTISGGTGTIFGTLTGYGNTIGTLASAADVGFSSGNILLNDNVNVGSGNVSNTAATLEVDNTVTITGNYSQGQAATLLVGVTSGTNYGSLVVTGSTTIASGSSIELKSTSGYGFAAGQRYVVVQTAGTATYNVSSLTYTVAGYTAGASGSSVAASNGSTDLVVTLNDTTSGSDSGSGSNSGSDSGSGSSSGTSYASHATQTNAINVLTGLLGYTGSSNAQLLNLYDATLAAIESGSSGVANRIGNQLSPLQTVRVGSVSTLDAMGVVGNHLDALRVAQGQGATGLSTGDDPLRWTAWGQAFGGHASQSERDNVAGYSANYGGLVLGADRTFGDNWRVGGAFHYSHTATNYSDDQAGDSAGVNAFGLIGYASYQGAPWYVNVSGAATQQHYDTTRVVSMTGYNGVANGSFNGQQYAVQAELGWPLAVASATLTPLASLTYSRLNQSGYTETGGNGAALTVGSTGSNSLRSALGAKLEKAYQTSYGTLVPVVWAQWIHEYDQTRQNSAAYFSGAADETGFTTTGATPVSNLADLSLGVTLVRANNLSLSMRYDLQVGSGFVSNTGILRLQQRF
ncbi:autotransporter domain-containing protein [Paraburkholderia tropica]|uniref:autotransporter domain-containing protein n=2 Tax=Paraburkholderia tropica TaxID=92647 RepID=UPI001F48B404|nr:autotransporter domain-containing protein [Paraburkholderia tropica]